MLRDSFTKWLWDNRRSILGWALGIAFVGGGYAAFWPLINSPELQAALDAYPKALLEAINYTDISTAAGYLNSTVYGLLGAVLLIVYGVSAGTRIVAGDEDAGTLDLILAHPISRPRVALSRFGAYLVSLIILNAALWLTLTVLIGPADLTGISMGDFLAMHLHLWLFAALFGAVSFAVGAATGRRALALSVGAAYGVFGFIANGVISQVEGWEWVKDISPFKWLNSQNPLRTGVEAGDALIMLGLTVLLVAIGTWAFQRRDVAV